MVNTAQQGAALERQVRQIFDDLGYLTARAAGSKGSAKVDVFAFHPVHGAVLVQCKLRDPLISPAERLAMCCVANICYAVPVVAYKATLPNRRVEIRFRELTGPGPKDWRTWSPPAREDDSNDQ